MVNGRYKLARSFLLGGISICRIKDYLVQGATVKRILRAAKALASGVNARRSQLTPAASKRYSQIPVWLRLRRFTIHRSRDRQGAGPLAYARGSDRPPRRRRYIDMAEIAKVYNPSDIEPRWAREWVRRTGGGV